MNRYFWVLLALPVALYGFFIAIYFDTLIEMSDAADAEYANIVANSCADAATAELLDTADIGVDYENYEEITIDPEKAIYEYGANLAIALGYQPTQEMVDIVLRDYVKVLYVCGYDGYYVYQVELSGDEKERHLQGTFKLPYTYVDESTGSVYALALNGNECWELTEIDGTAYLRREQESPLSKDLVNAYINKRISDDMNKRVSTMRQNGWSNQILLPAQMSSITTTNPVTGPTVLALVDGIGSTTSFGIGGTKLTNSRPVVGYERDNQLYYAYSDLLRGDERNGIIATFDSIDDAAAAGYHFDPVIMVRSKEE